MRKYVRAVIRILLIVFALIVLLPLLLYIPAVQSYVCQRVVSALNENTPSLTYSVGEVRIDFPLEVNVRRVSACRADGDTVLYVGRLYTGLNNIPFFQEYFVVNRLGIEEVQLNMGTATGWLTMSGKVDRLDVQRIAYDPGKNRLQIGQVDLSCFTLMMTMLPDDEPDEEDDDDEPSRGWDIEVGKLTMDRGEYILDRPQSAFFLHTAFDRLEVAETAVQTAPVSVQVGSVDLAESLVRLDLDSTAVIPYYDYNHMNFHGVNLSATDVFYDADRITAWLHSLQATEDNCGMQVQELTADFRMDSTLIHAQDFKLVMPGTDLAGNVVLDYEFFTDPHPGVFWVNLAGKVAGTDVVRYTAPYLPDVATYFPQQQTVNLDVNLYANRDSLNVSRCDVRMDDWMSLQVSGTGEHIFSGKKGVMELNAVIALHHADSLVSAFVAPPDSRSYCVPDSLIFCLDGGQRQGTYYADLLMAQGDNTSLVAEGTYAYATEQYSCKVQAEHVDLRDFVPALAVRHLTAEATLQGKKFDVRSKGAELKAEVRLDTLIASARDHINDVRLDGALADHRYTVTLQSRDPRVGLEADVHGLLAADTLTSEGKMRIDHLQAALFTIFEQERGAFSSDLRWQLHSDWDECHSVDLRFDSLTYEQEGSKPWAFDNVAMTFGSKPHYMSAVLKGGDCHATLQMDCGVGEVSAVIDTLTREVNSQLSNICLHADRITDRLPQMDLRVSMEQDNPFYPILTYYDLGFSKLGLHLHNDRQLNLDVLATDYEYATTHFDTLYARLNPLADNPGVATPDYAYHLNVMHTALRQRKSYNAQMEGELHDDSVTVHFALVNGLQTQMYDLGASLAMADDTVTLHFMERPIIYGQQLEVNAQNFVQVSAFKHPELQRLGVMADLKMEGPRGFAIGLQTEPDHVLRGNLLDFTLHHLDLAYLSQTLKLGNSVSGIANLDGTIFVRPDSLDGRFGLHVDGFDALRSDRNVLTATYRDVTVAGEKQPIVSAIVADSLPLALANLFMPENVPLAGFLNGRIDYTGPERGKEMPQGGLQMVDATVRYLDADATLHFPTDTLRIADGVIRFDQYGVTAAGKNPLLVNGVVDLSEELSAPKVDLTVKGNNVTLFRSDRIGDKTTQYISGTLPANVNLRLKGTSPDLMLTGSVSALTGSDLNYYLQEDPLKSDSKLNDLVEFVEFSKLNKHTTSLLLKSNESVGGFGVNIRIDVARNAALGIHLSATDDDKIAVRGGGALQFSMAQDGSTNLNGTYDITSGDVAFKLPMLPVSKSFSIVDGSILRWNGETENPELNITASEDVRCTINDENGVSRVVTFTVYVYIQGTMDNLALTFSCAANDDASLQNQISSLTEEERSKQAIRLLVTQSYSGPGVTTSSSMASANGAINALLQQEVESFFNQHMKNTQISLGIDTYDADGSGTARTDYSVKISQSLFNDRVRIVLGGRVSSGEDAGSNSEDAIINDFSLEWLLREDGGHYLRLFRKTNYESILEGEIVETGIGYVMQRSSYRLMDLLIPNSEKRRQRMLQRIKQLDLTQPQLPALDSLLSVPDSLRRAHGNSLGTPATK